LYSVSVDDSFATLTFFDAKMSVLCPAVSSAPVPPCTLFALGTVQEEYSGEARAKPDGQKLAARTPHPTWILNSRRALSGSRQTPADSLAVARGATL
jgi:hypothetical protein